MIYFALNSIVLLLLKHLFSIYHNSEYCNLFIKQELFIIIDYLLFIIYQIRTIWGKKQNHKRLAEACTFKRVSLSDG